MNLPLFVQRLVRLAAAAAFGALLSGCATPGANQADGCVGPAEYCNVYFGS
ncbi:hypothetical protein NX868_30105 [Burkholderia thailandensis]|uniref:hypothetical protein n=1 Tax=Burkholderia thailandensis TaxID=57975 RepID=UPI00037FDC21|nr:hypothetical protein [Burkholderia thailandensis]AHI64180.1 putative lipoprotein [Burkholderia thailandensis H0587]MCS3395451.1 hypothetical protein [Burkholderia thailandensis]MCS6429111.1 hypothetical protein [Burkholderia thailandensis]MCS6456811.1 hypothetical protein [Burkholderia thailandensis]MCS6468125.1 hypothetical protein [Burkholderia thailandensis]